ncbi:hypothetical protein AAVH_43624, partial [Aphelenchoides avenae]
MQTERGKPIEEKDRYLMVPYKTYKDTQYWRCLLYDQHDCKARGQSEVGSRAIRMTKDHNGHLPDSALAAKYRVATSVKAAAKVHILAPSGQIIDQKLAELTQEETAKVPRRSAIMLAVYRARNLVQGGAVDQGPEHMQLPPVFQQTKDHQQDGTFFCRPKHFAQLYVIGEFKKRSFVPCAYFLLPNKEAATYQRAFNAFFTLSELCDASPADLMADLEVAPSSAMKELFPDVRVVHCQFHLAQNLLKHIREKGLIDVYRNEECRLLLRSLWALAFLPPDEVE